MQQDTRMRGDAVPQGEGMLPDRSVVERQPGTIASGPPGVGSVTGVPSEQLWRAAVLAAREAALTAAELRRSIEARRAAG